MNDLDVPLFCGFEIDRGIPVCRRGDHAELGQALDDAARHRRALPHHADDLEWLKALDDGVGVREMVVKYGDGRAPIQHRPVRERKSDVLVVVEDGYSKALLLGSHRVPPERCDPLATRPTGRLPGGVEFAATPRAEISEAAALVTRAVEKTRLFMIMISLLQGSGVSRLSRRQPTVELWRGFDCRPAGRSRHYSCRPSPDRSGREARYSSAS